MPKTSDVEVQTSDGRKFLDGSLTEDGGYVKHTWQPYKNVFSEGTRYLLIRRWEQIRDKVRWIEIQDRAAPRTIHYRISVEDAERGGKLWGQPGTLRVPTECWTKTYDS